MARELVKKEESKPTVQRQLPNAYAKVVHIHAGLDLIGSVQSLDYRKGDIEVYDWGVRMVSKKTGRVISIYAANIKGIEEFPSGAK